MDYINWIQKVVKVVSPEILAELSDSVTPQGVVAQIALPQQELPPSSKW